MSTYKRTLNDLIFMSTLKTARFDPRDMKLSCIMFAAIYYDENPILLLGSYKNPKTIEAAKKLIHDTAFKKIMGVPESGELLYGAVGGNTINWSQCSSAIVQKRKCENIPGLIEEKTEIIAMMAGNNAQKPLSLLCVYDGFSRLFDSSCPTMYDGREINDLI